MPRPFKDNYGVTLTIAILAIAPFIFVTTAGELFGKDLQSIGVTRLAASIVSGLAIAGYAFGAMLAGDLIQRFAQRSLFFMCEVLFVAGCAIAAGAKGTVMFGAGSVLMGLATGLLLVIALPPAVRSFGAARMPTTAAFVNIGFFGAVTAGPLVGGAVAYGHVWRWFYIGMGAIGCLALLLALFTLPDNEPQNPDQKFDSAGVCLAFVATVLPFWATAELTGHGFRSFLFMVPLAVGIAAFVALLLTQFHREEPLAPIKPMWNTAPICGVLVAMFGGAALVTFMELIERFEVMAVHHTPLSAGLLFWPEVAGTLIAAAALGAAVRTRLLVLLPLAGMLLLIAAGVLMLFVRADSSPSYLLAITGLLGLGAGSTVAPGLWVAGFALPSKMIGRTFALVELVRSEADFVIAPVILGVALAVSGGDALNAQGFYAAAGITLLVTIVSTAAVVAIYLAGGVGLPEPDLETWLEKPEENQPAIRSPEMGTAIKERRAGA